MRTALRPISQRASSTSRIAASAAMRDNLVVPTQVAASTLSITISGERASRLLLPIVNQSVVPTVQVVDGGIDGESGGFAFRRPEDPALP